MSSRSVVAAAPTGDGLVIVDKPAGWTSHDVVARTRRLAGTRKVGHAGTLDPMATGVLVLGVNRATRLLTYLVGADKGYDATIRLGQSTVTDDAEGEVIAAAPAGHLDDEAIEAGMRALTGDIDQVPSSVSAVKVDGRRSYARVRAGESVQLAARPVTVRSFDVIAVRREVEPDLDLVDDSVIDGSVIDIDVRVECTSGTYVRALARDLGAALGSGGHLTALRRTRVGPYGLDVAHTLDQLESSFELLGVAQAARAAFAVRELTDDESVALSHGRRLPAVGLGPDPVGAYAPDGTLVALLEERGDVARPVLVLAPAR